MAVWILGIDWRRSELLKIALKGQEVLCLTENFYPPDASLRRKLHHLTSLCLMMLFCCFYRAAVSENNPWASPNIKSGKGLFSDQQVISVTLALPFFLIIKKKKITLFHWNCVHLSPSGSAACSRMCLGVLGIQELLFGWCDAAVPGAGAVCPLDAGVMVGLATVHLLLDHQVCPQALLRSRDFTGQRGTAHNLQKHSTIRSLWHQTIRDGCHLKYHCC